MLAAPVGASAATAPSSTAVPRASVVRIFAKVEDRLVAADDLASDVQLVPAAAQLRAGLEGPSAQAVSEADRRDEKSLRSDLALARVLAADVRRDREAARAVSSAVRAHDDRTAAAIDRARKLLLKATAVLSTDNRTLGRDLAAIRARSAASHAASRHNSAAPLLQPRTGPTSGTPAIVSVGDSYISGEGGRWAGNSNFDYAGIDALGPAAYYPPGGSSEEIDGCHRSRVAEINIPGFKNMLGLGTNVITKNLACSGATTRTQTGKGLVFKPGLDFYSQNGQEGQARQLQLYALAHNVRMVVMSIGGNDFEFSDVIKKCVLGFLLSAYPGAPAMHCHTFPAVTAEIASALVRARQVAIQLAMERIETAMKLAGYAPSQWTLVVQNYPAPLPASDQIRYPEFGLDRQVTGGCGFWDDDVDWARSSFLSTVNSAVSAAAAGVQAAMPVSDRNILMLNLGPTYAGHELCSKRTSLINNWRASGAWWQSEWFTQIRTITTIGPFYLQEGLHPNYWGQFAVGTCLSELWNSGQVGVIPTGSTVSCPAQNLPDQPIVKLTINRSNSPPRNAVSR